MTPFVKIIKSDFLVPILILKVQMAHTVNFSNLKFSMSNSESGSHKTKMGGVAIILSKKKMLITIWHTVVTVQDTKLKPVQHWLVFLEFNMSQRSSTDVNLQPIYEPIDAYFSEFYFVIPGSRNGIGQKLTFCGRKLFDPASMKNAQINFERLYF